jgi:hypothetical protein
MKLRLQSRCIFFDQAAIDANDFQGPLLQVMGFFCVEGQDLPCNAIGYNQCRDRFGSQASHGLKPVAPVRSPESIVRRGDCYDRIEKATSFVDDVGKSPMMRVREIALEGRRLDSPDGQDRKQQRMPSERFLIEAHNTTTGFFDCLGDSGGLVRGLIETAFGRT